MYLLQKPSLATIQAFIKQESPRPCTYPASGATRQATPPPKYTVDHNRIYLGTGYETFVRAKAALQRWEMFNLGWVILYGSETPPTVDTTVAILVRVWGLWVLNAARVVYLIDEAAGPVARYGFAYGTLPDHAERGEERFMIEWRRSDDTVWYDLYAFSQPHHWLARLGYPVVRSLQKRFARESLQAMKWATQLQENIENV